MGRPQLILVDTHVVIWLALEADRISKTASVAIDDARRSGGGLAISAITLLELAGVFNKRRFHLDVSLEAFLQEVELRFVVLPITSRACARTLALPPAYPKDPADRLIGATALVEGLALITADREIRRTKAVRTIW